MEDEGTRRFPLREAYVFAANHGLAAESDDIRNMDIEWDRGYTSSVRRGRFIELLEGHQLLPQFIEECWPVGRRGEGEGELRKCRRLYGQYKEYLATGDESTEVVPTRNEEAEQFALEAHLRDFLAKNLERVEPGLRLYSAGDQSGVEFPVQDGRIDLLGVDAQGKYVVIELKLSRGRNRTLGQILYGASGNRVD